MTVPAERPRIVADLVLDGWHETARRMYRVLRNWGLLRMVVWVDGAGCVWIRGVRKDSTFAPPEGQHLATYGAGVPINVIEDELLFHLREMTRTNQRIAARTQNPPPQPPTRRR